MNVLSIVIPAYNESATLENLVEQVLKISLTEGISKEIILINDCSKDTTLEIMHKLAKQHKEIKIINNEHNLGKSQSVRKGILKTRGSLVVIQDADLEYDPSEIAKLVELLQKKQLDVVYGNRFGKKNKVIYLHYYLGNKFISFISNIFTFPRIRVWIPDVEVCYKLMDGKIARAMGHKLVSKSTFGLEPEITARLSRYKKEGKHLKFGIVPISYRPRSIGEGKHLRAVRDGLKALLEILKFNLGKV